MALLGQASGGFTESTSALRILHVGVRNTIGQLVAEAFTQTNPPVVTATATVSQSSGLTLNAGVLGVLSGSIAFARPDGDNTHGGPTDAGAAPGQITTQRVLGVFINNAVGTPFTNQPGIASNRGPYVSAQGSYGNKLYETQNLDTEADLTYTVGDRLVASLNGYLTNVVDGDNAHDIAHDIGGAAEVTTIAILTIVPDSSSDELVYDQRI
jgi:hypothetical protein